MRINYAAGYYKLTHDDGQVVFLTLTAEQARVLLRPRRVRGAYGGDSLAYSLGYSAWELLEAP